MLPKRNKTGGRKEVKLQKKSYFINLFIHLTSNLSLMLSQYINIILYNLWKLYNLLRKPEFYKTYLPKFGKLDLLPKQSGIFQ